MDGLDEIKSIFENAILMDFHKFGILLEQQANQRNIAGCCELILTLRLKLKPHFRRLAELLQTSLVTPEQYTHEERLHLQAIFNGSDSLPTGYEQTSINDKLKNINKTFEEAGWELPKAPRVLGDFWSNPACQ